VSASRKKGHRRAAGPPQPAAPTLAARVRELAPGTSWEQARALCRAGKVWVDGQPATDPAWRPGDGCRVELRPEKGEGESEGAGEAGVPPTPSLVVYADADLVVVRKPPGMLTVPFDRGDRDTLLALTRVALRRLEASGRPGAARPPAPARVAANPTLRAVQRLDKDTSGLVVFARSVAAQRALQQQLARREVTRRYVALAHGAARAATHETWLVADRGDGLRGSWGARPGATGGAPPPGARHAVTHVRVLETLRGATLVSCELETGRQHQIRIHLAEAGHPLLGETVYVRDYRGARLAAPRPMLHAAALGFRHPRDGRPLLFEEPPPADFAAVLQRLREPRRARGGRNLPGGPAV
jgi:23S rRNA pseudouridine1911/1915/1917 synthase